MATFTAYPNRDAYYTSSTLNTDPGQWVGGNAGTPNHYVARFTNVTITKNSTISSATLTIDIASGSGTTKLTIGLEAADNPAYPSSAADAAGRTLTSSTAAYNRAYSGGSYTTASWAGSAQEVVDRSGWASGQAWQLFARDNASAAWNYIQPYGVAAAGTANDPYITVNYTEPADALTATSIATAAPSVGTPTLGQTHVLTATGVASGAPTVGTPDLGQTHVLVGAGVASGASTVGTPAIGQIHALTADSVASGSPTVGSPVLGQIHALTADSVSSGTPTVGSPSLSVVVNLTGDSVSAGSPTVGTPALGQLHALVAAAVSSGAPTVGSPSIGQVHVLLADGVSSGAPTVGSPVLAITGAPPAASVVYTAQLASSAPKLAAVTSTRPQSAAVPRSNPR